jgi:tetratricopeptide (TPR) repeat protein
MKFFRYLVFLAALPLLFGVPAHADEAVVPSPPSSPPSSLSDVRNEALGQTVYQVLLAEIAFHRDDLGMAVQTYARLALRTRDPQVMERAIGIAGFAQQFDTALEIARLWLDVDPTSQRAQEMLAGILITSNRLGELAPHLARILESNKAALPENLLGLNRMFARNSDRLAVFRLIDTVCRPFFGIAEAHYAVALAAAGAEMRERARKEVGQALELRPEWEMAAMLHAQVLMRDARDEAISFMEDFLERNPGANRLRLLFARVLAGERRYADAKRQFDRLLQDAPNDPEIVYSVAMLSLQIDDKAFAEAQFERLAALDDVPDRGVAHFFLGQIAEEGGRIDEAMARYARVVSGEHYFAARARQARLLFERGRSEEGRALLRNTKTSQPEERLRMEITEAALLREAGRTREALDFLEQRLAENPEQADLMYETALLAERLNLLDLMERRLRRLIELRPSNPQAYNALGYAYADRNERLPEARQLIEKAFSLAPEDAAILDSMGWVLFRLGDLPGALSYLERSHGRRDDPEIAAHLGEVLWSMGRRDDARRLLQNARAKFPSNAVLSETMRRLDL